MPAHVLLTRRVLAKQREAQELAAMLQKVLDLSVQQDLRLFSKGLQSMVQ